MAERLLYLVRHGEAAGHNDDSPLTELGRAQSEAVAARLAAVEVATFHHSPLRRAAETAQIVAATVGPGPPTPEPLVGDLMPANPRDDAMPEAFSEFVAGFTNEERTVGPAMAAEAITRFAADPTEDGIDLIVTHNFTIGWFVSHAVHSSDWTWLSLNQFNAAITIIRYRTGLPPSLVSFNDLGHLPPELRGETPVTLRT